MANLGAAILLLAFGLPNLIWPYRMARLGEQLDAIGSKRSYGDLEPTNWNVHFTRLAGVVFVAVGVLLAITV